MVSRWRREARREARRGGGCRRRGGPVGEAGYKTCEDAPTQRTAAAPLGAAHRGPPANVDAPVPAPHHRPARQHPRRRMTEHLGPGVKREGADALLRAVLAASREKTVAVRDAGAALLAAAAKVGGSGACNSTPGAGWRGRGSGSSWVSQGAPSGLATTCPDRNPSLRAGAMVPFPPPPRGREKTPCFTAAGPSDPSVADSRNLHPFTGDSARYPGRGPEWTAGGGQKGGWGAVCQAARRWVGRWSPRPDRGPERPLRDCCVRRRCQSASQADGRGGAISGGVRAPAQGAGAGGGSHPGAPATRPGGASAAGGCWDEVAPWCWSLRGATAGTGAGLALLS